MRDILINQLHQYIQANNPDVLLLLEDENRVTAYLQSKVITVEEVINTLQAEGKPPYIIEEVCMEALTKDLRPSRFNYITAILEEEFETVYQQLLQTGTLPYEVINLIDSCTPVFETLGFTEDKTEDANLRYAIMGTIADYLLTTKM
jgi:hypothetical protein